MSEALKSNDTQYYDNSFDSSQCVETYVKTRCFPIVKDSGSVLVEPSSRQAGICFRVHAPTIGACARRECQPDFRLMRRDARGIPRKKLLMDSLCAKMLVTQAKSAAEAAD